MLPWKRTNSSPLYRLHTSSRPQCVRCCHENATMGSLYICFRDTKYFALLSNIWTYLGLYGKYFCPTLTEFQISRQLNAEVLNIKFHANPYSGSCSDISGQIDGQNDRHGIDNRRFSRLMWMRPITYTDKTTRTGTLDCGINTSLLSDIQALCSIHLSFAVDPNHTSRKSY